MRDACRVRRIEEVGEHALGQSSERRDVKRRRKGSRQEKKVPPQHLGRAGTNNACVRWAHATRAARGGKPAPVMGCVFFALAGRGMYSRGGLGTKSCSRLGVRPVWCAAPCWIAGLSPAPGAGLSPPPSEPRGVSAGLGPPNAPPAAVGGGPYPLGAGGRLPGGARGSSRRDGGAGFSIFRGVNNKRKGKKQTGLSSPPTEDY